MWCCLQIVDQKSIKTVGVTHQYCVRASGGPLAVTLAWADFPCSPSAASCLINDLDLTVKVLSTSMPAVTSIVSASRVHEACNVRTCLMQGQYNWG